MAPYFNDRYQTYSRRVHGYIYFGGRAASRPTRQADAAAAYAKVKPFATISIGLRTAEAPMPTTSTWRGRAS